MDALLTWIEQQEDPIDDKLLDHGGSAPMINAAPSIREVSRQLWALLNPLVKDAATVATTFANVPRHNGIEGWRRIAEPVNEDKLLIQKELLTKVTNPKSASSMDRIEQAVEDWTTDIRLFCKAGGTAPEESKQRMTLVSMLPLDIAGYITMHMELPAVSYTHLTLPTKA